MGADLTPRVTTAHDKRAGWISVAEGWAVPTRFQAHIDDPTAPYRLHLDIRVHGGRGAEVVGLLVELRPNQMTSPGGVTSEGLRRVKVASAVQLAMENARQPTDVDDAGSPLGAFRMPGDPAGLAWTRAEPKGPGRGRRMDDAHLRKVASAYRHAIAGGSRSPVADVARQMYASRSSAGRWVGQARDAGLLGPALGPVAGEITSATSTPRKKGRKS